MLRGSAILMSMVALLGPFTVSGQQDDGLPPAAAIPLERLRLSSPPALALLGISPASVTRPNTPRDLIASLVSAAGSSGIVPSGYSLETAPFWLTRHRSLTIANYYRASLLDRLRYFTAFSAATSREEPRSDSVRPDARVAMAIRTLLFNGRPNSNLLKAADSIRSLQLTYIDAYRRWETTKPAAGGIEARRQRLRRQEELLATLTTRVLLGPETSLRDSTMRTLARRDSARASLAAAERADAEVTRLENEMERLEARLESVAETWSDEDLEPDGFILEAAAGTRAVFDEGEWSREQVDGVGFWVTPMYRVARQRLELIGLGRYLTNVDEYDGTDLLDLGARIGLDIGRGALSAEVVRRSIHGSSDRGADAITPASSRWAAIFTYPLSRKLQVISSFGSDYRKPAGERPVIATIGLNLGVGAVMIVPTGRQRRQ